MEELRWYSLLAERSRQETIREFEIHSKHVSAWMYKGEPRTPCPCVSCHKERRDARG